MLAQVFSVALKGIAGYPVSVEADLANGLPGFVTVGLPDTAVRESRERVISAVRNSGFEFPRRRITINLAPAQARKEGSSFDLPMALAVLSASGQIQPTPGRPFCFVGELALDGALRPVPGVLSMALEAKARGFEAIVVPAENAEEARSGGLFVYGLRSLREAAQLWGGGPAPAAPAEKCPEPAAVDPKDGVDLADVRGQFLAKRALEVAAAGSHNLLLVGCPGVGKSMLARRLNTILPPLSETESLEVTRIHSAAVRPAFRGLIRSRPFRAPHHGASTAALVGGGTHPRPGEASLAHGGVLFLDEAAEFSRVSLEALRQPLEDGSVTVARASETLTFPARFLLVAACNPCPCGWLGHRAAACLCTPLQVKKYLSRLSGPLIDRIDLQVEMAPLDFKDWEGGVDAVPAGGTSREVRARVEAARRVQARRFNGRAFAANATMGPHELKRHARPDAAGLRLLEAAAKKMNLSARSLDRTLKVARTIADMAGTSGVSAEHVAEALQFRRLDRGMGKMV